MSILEELKGTTIEGIHCSACDFVITIYGETSNREFLAAGRVHDRRYHSDSKTSYDIRTSMKISVFRPVTSIKLQTQV